MEPEITTKSGPIICPLMTTGYTYRQCVNVNCTLWSEPDQACGIMAIVDLLAQIVDGGEDDDR